MNFLTIIIFLLLQNSIFAGEGTSAGGTGKGLLAPSKLDSITPTELFKKTLMRDKSWRKILKDKWKLRVVFPSVKVKAAGISKSASNFCISGHQLISNQFKDVCIRKEYYGPDDKFESCVYKKRVPLETSIYYNHTRCKKLKTYGANDSKSKCLEQITVYRDHSRPKIAQIYKIARPNSDKIDKLLYEKKFNIPECE